MDSQNRYLPPRSSSHGVQELPYDPEKFLPMFCETMIGAVHVATSHRQSHPTRFTYLCDFIACIVRQIHVRFVCKNYSLTIVLKDSMLRNPNNNCLKFLRRLFLDITFVPIQHSLPSLYSDSNIFRLISFWSTFHDYCSGPKDG